MLDLIRRYVGEGGSWWETAGYSFYRAVWPNGAAWQDQAVAAKGIDYLGLAVGDGPVHQPPGPLSVTETGREWLGMDLAVRVERLKSAVNRGLPDGATAPGHVTLIAGERQGFLGGYRLNGWGYLWRFGGLNPNPEVALPAAVRTMEYLYAHAPILTALGTTRYLWHARLSSLRG